MPAQATVAAQGNNTTRVYPNQLGPAVVLQPGAPAFQITSPTDVAVDPGGIASVVTSDGSTVGVGPRAAFSLYQAGLLPSLNAWDIAVTDLASGWAFRFSSLSVPGAQAVDVGAPNASDGLVITAPDNTTLTLTDPALQNTTVVPTWADSGNGQMQITQIIVVTQDQSQWTWTLGQGWSGLQADASLRR